MKHGTKLIAVLLSTMVTSCTGAATIEVQPGQSIEAAIKRARPGDTVAVRAGTYYESVYSHASGVRIISVDGKGAAHIVSPEKTALFIQGGSDNEIRGFRLTAGPRGNGLQVGGSIHNFASGYVVADNIIHDAGLDGIKVHQANGFTFLNNVIENAGTGNAGNFDGGMDLVAVTDSKIEGNTIIKTGGNSCLMLKGGTSRNIIIRNSFSGCKDAIHLGGFTFAEPKPGVKEAYDNTITLNYLCATSMVFRLFPGEKARGDNSISGNNTATNCMSASGDGALHR